jgi:undecaprenyl-diphosphatase
MIDTLKYLDRDLTVWINQQNHPGLDEIMWWISSVAPFLLLILLALFYANRKFGLRGMWFFLIGLLITFALADLVSVRAFKEVFMRLRPSNNPHLTDLLSLYILPNGDIYTGGKYGFVSSHAANFAALATFIALVFKPRRNFLIILVLTHILIIYSRVYLGVHYVGDVVVGSLVGFVCGWIVYQINQRLLVKYNYYS